MATYESIVDGGGIRYVARLLQTGYTPEQARSRLSGQYPGTAAQTIRGVVAQAENAYRAGAEITVGSGDDRHRAGDVPRVRGTDYGYHYSTIVSYRDPRSGNLHTYTLSVSNSGPLTRDEIGALATDDLMRRAQGAAHYPWQSDDLATFSIQFVDVISAYRV